MINLMFLFIKQRPNLVGIGVSFLILVILLSGCIIPIKSPLEKNFSRVTEEPELADFFQFLEKLNLINYFGVSSSSNIIFSDFDGHTGYLVHNITRFLINAEEHYKTDNEPASGRIELYITGRNETSTNQTYIREAARDWFKGSPYVGSSPQITQGFYFVNNSYHELVGPDLNETNVKIIFDEINFPSWYWLVWIGFGYDWSAMIHSCRGYDFSYIILATPEFNIFAFFGSSGFPIC